MIIPDDYYKKELEVKLTEQDIDVIIDELNRVSHNVFTFLGYEKIIKKLKEKQKWQNYQT